MCYNLAPGRKSGWFYRSFSLNILGLWLVGLNHTTREHPALRKMMSTTVSKSQIWCVLQYSDASILFPIIVRIERLSATAEYTTMNALTNIASKQLLLRRGHVQIPRNFLIHIPDFDVWRESGAPNLEVTICLTSERLVLDRLQHKAYGYLIMTKNPASTSCSCFSILNRTTRIAQEWGPSQLQDILATFPPTALQDVETSV